MPVLHNAILYDMNLNVQYVWKSNKTSGFHDRSAAGVMYGNSKQIEPYIIDYVKMNAYFRDSSDEPNFPNFGSLFLITPIFNLHETTDQCLKQPPPINTTEHYCLVKLSQVTSPRTATNDHEP